MTTSGDAQLFDDTFVIIEFDQSKYDRVARIKAVSTDSQTKLSLDINTELYPLQQGETIHCVVATSLALDGSKDDGRGWRDVGRSGHGGEATLADMFDYVCHGKVYKFQDGGDGQTIKAYLSFGGLLCSIDGPYKKVASLRVEYAYLLIKK